MEREGEGEGGGTEGRVDGGWCERKKEKGENRKNVGVRERKRV